MSTNLMAQAMSTKVGNPLRKLVLIKIADSYTLALQTTLSICAGHVNILNEWRTNIMRR